MVVGCKEINLYLWVIQCPTDWHYIKEKVMYLLHLKLYKLHFKQQRSCLLMSVLYPKDLKCSVYKPLCYFCVFPELKQH